MQELRGDEAVGIQCEKRESLRVHHFVQALGVAFAGPFPGLGPVMGANAGWVDTGLIGLGYYVGHDWRANQGVPPP